jgi:transcriptional regulator with XRE-family HTH domain/tetratricopeptide (TPR) repeat protein
VPTVFNHRLVARARLDLGLTQEEAAAAAGVDVRTWRRYESGEVNEAGEGFSVRHPSRRRILARIARELGIAEDDLLAEAAAPAQPKPAPGWAACHAHALPRARHFVGRAAVLDVLRRFWERPAEGPRVIALIALGGAGKTSIVERFLAEIGDGPHPGGIFVWSFYDDPRVEGFLDRALGYFAPDRAVAPGERVQALVSVLGEGPHLLVLDGLEVVQGTGQGGTTLGRVEDGALRRFLAGAARGLGQTRVLVTSRVALADLEAWEGSGLSTLHVDALSEAEGLELLGRWGLGGSRGELRALLDRVGRHALSVAVMGSYAGAFLGGDAARARSMALDPAARDDPAARRLLGVLAAYARALAPEERDLVARLSLFPAGAELSVLAAIAEAGGVVAGATAGLRPPDLQRILARLERLGLISGSAARSRWGETPHTPRSGGDPPADRARYATHPFLAEYFQSLLGVAPEEVHAATRAHFAARLDAHGPGPVEAARLDAYEALLLSTLRSGHADEAAEIYLRGLGGFSHLGLRLGEMSRGARVLAAFSGDGDPARITAALAPHRRARVAYDRGLYAGALGDLDLAARCYRAQNEIARSAGSLAWLSTGLRTLAYTERLRGALEDALVLATTAADLAAGAGSSLDVVRAAALRASILHDLGRVEEAAAGFAGVRRSGEPLFARRGLWEAEHALELGRFEALRTETEQNLESCRELGWGGHVAHARTVLGLAALPGDPGAARAHLEAAQRWAGATGEVEVILRCLELSTRISLAEQSFHRTAALAREGRALAETTGFGLFAVRFGNLAAAHALAARPPAEALAAAEAALASARACPAYAWGLADALHTAGAAAAAAGCRERALDLVGEAAEARSRLGHPGSQEALARARENSCGTGAG